MSPIRRVQIFFVVQMMSVGMINGYGGIWFDSFGLTPFQIGLIGAFPVAVLFCITLLTGRLADRASDWRQVIILCAIAAGVFPIGLYFVGGFAGIAVVWTLLAVAQRLIIPVADAAAMRMTRRSGMQFGKIRGLGTIGYLSVIILAGFALRDNINWFLPVFVALSLLRTVAALGLPRMRDAAPPKANERANFKVMLKPWFVLPLVGWAMIDSNHIVLNAFQGLLWAKQGISTDVIGLLIALGALAETVMFFNFHHVVRRFSPMTIMIAAGVMSVVRWTAMALQPDVPVLIGLQVLHAITYAMGFLACTHFIADKVSEDNAAEAQSFFVMLELALSAFALAGFGWIAGIWGAGAYFAAAAVAGTGIIIIAASSKLPR